jgi:protein-S-isoprenylcysteine O-methyltransferase Ste14
VPISETPHLAQRVASYSIIVCWFAFALTFWLRKRPPQTQEAKRDWTYLVGLLLQGAAFLFVWIDPFPRTFLLPSKFESEILEWGLTALVVAIGVGSVWLVNAAVRQLGKQWALAARLVEGHELIHEGPYRFVRNPIYTGMLGMLAATGLAAGRWLPLIVAIVVFLIGTYIRVQSEERPLQRAFGSEFDEYVSAVPALIPGIY